MRALILTTAFAFAALPAAAQSPEMIGEVDAATARLVSPGTVEVCATGTVPTGGWTQAAIRPAARAPAHGGVYDLDFTAVRPTGLATQMVSHIQACFTWRGAPAGLTGVRVRGVRAAAVATVSQGGG